MSTVFVGGSLLNFNACTLGWLLSVPEITLYGIPKITILTLNQKDYLLRGFFSNFWTLHISARTTLAGNS